MHGAYGPFHCEDTDQPFDLPPVAELQGIPAISAGDGAQTGFVSGGNRAEVGNQLRRGGSDPSVCVKKGHHVNFPRGKAPLIAET
jgi:hypothetical protein